MDPFTAALALVTEVMKLRAQWWESLTPETKTLLAEKYAAGELQWLAFLESLRPK
jgi:hypothetical protein